MDKSQDGHDSRECDASRKEDRTDLRACDELITSMEDDKAHANFVSFFRENLDRVLPDILDCKKRRDLMLEVAESDVTRKALKETLALLAAESARGRSTTSHASSKQPHQNKEHCKSRPDSDVKKKRKQPEGQRRNVKQKTRPVLDEPEPNTAGRPSAKPQSGESHTTAHTAAELRPDTTPCADQASPLLQTPVDESFDCFRSEKKQPRTKDRDKLFKQLQQRIHDAAILNELCSMGPELQTGCEFFGAAPSPFRKDFLEQLQQLRSIPQPDGHKSDDPSQGFYTPGSLSTTRDHDAATPNDLGSIGQEHENGEEIFGGENATSRPGIISPELWAILSDLSALDVVPTGDILSDLSALEVVPTGQDSRPETEV